MEKRIEEINESIAALEQLRAGMVDLFDLLANSVALRSETAGDAMENKTAALQTQVLTKCNQITHCLSAVERRIKALEPLGNISRIALLESLDTEVPGSSFYKDLFSSQQMFERVKVFSELAADILSENRLQRSTVRMMSDHTKLLPFAWYMRWLFDSVNSEHLDFEIVVNSEKCPVIEIRVAQLFRAYIFYKGIIIDRVTVRGYHEPAGLNHLLSASRHKVFKKIENHTISAILHYFLPNAYVNATKCLIRWLSKYHNLFTEPCKNCRFMIFIGVPPTWRDFKTFDAYHYECRHQ